MPSFVTEVRYLDVDVDIEVEEFYDEMDKEEKQEMYDLLVEDKTVIGRELNKPSGRSSWEFDEAITKLKANYYSLTNEETDAIIRMAKRF